jgi:nitrogen regulatory protein PII
MYMILFVLDNPDRLNEVLEAWEKAGVRGATIIETTGMHRVRRQFIPMRYISALVSQEENHLTLLAMVKGESHVQACLKGAESVVGNLDEPNTGIFAAWPISIVKGLPEQEE